MWLNRFSRRARKVRRRIASAVAETLEPRRLLSFTVSNTNDSGTGSLRQAILNVDSGGLSGQIIDFALPGSGIEVIQPLTPLPAITISLTIDGSTQPGFSGTPLIEIDGSQTGAAATGIEIDTGPVTLNSLIILDFSGAGINMLGAAGGNTVTGDYIGMDPTGAAGPNSDGIDVNNIGGNIIGGVSAQAADFIAGNTNDGINIANSSGNNQIIGNFIGTNPPGTAAVANGQTGIFVAGANNTIGGTFLGDRNIISGNTNGVLISGPAASGNLVQANFIGTDVSGLVALGNLGNGVELAGGASGNTLGASSGGGSNLISGNGADGILITGSGTNSNSVIENLIGTDPSGANPLGNARYGVEIAGAAASNLIGDGTATNGNTIAFNGAGGVGIVAASTAAGNSIRGNSIVNNNGLPIDLNEDGPTANTPNNVLNSPVITSATYSGGTLTVNLSLNAQVGAMYTFDFYSIESTGAEVFLGTLPARPVDANGNAVDIDQFTVGTSGLAVVATSTSLPGTSEASAPVPIAYPPFVVTNTADSGAGSFRQALADAQAFGDGATVDFAIPATGVQTIAPVTPLPPITTFITIDGTSQPGYAGSPLIVLNGGGAGAASGLQLFTSSATILGLDIIDFQMDGIQIGSPGTPPVEPGTSPVRPGPGNSIIISSDYIGIDPTGTALKPNGTGIEVDAASNVLIGGSSPGAGNVISGNINVGIFLNQTSGAVIEQNRIGTDVTGFHAVPNNMGGIEDQAAGNDTITGNLISGNTADGIAITGTPVGEEVIGNFIGVNAAGTGPLPNAGDGIGVTTSEIGPAAPTIIGVPGAGNLISGNGGAGVNVFGTGAQNVRVQDNLIGADSTGTTVIGNTGPGIILGGLATNDTVQGNTIVGNHNDGIQINHASSILVIQNLIGANATLTAPLGNTGYGIQMMVGSSLIAVGGTAAGNVIAFNGLAGVGEDATSTNQGNTILNNSIFQNAGLGIDLGEDGVTTNGSNVATNFPVIVDSNTISGVTTVDGALSALAGIQYEIQFFASTTNDPTGFGEGQIFVGQVTVTTDGSGNFDFSGTQLATTNPGRFISATATQVGGSTSEFSSSVIIGPIATQNPGGVVTTHGSGGDTSGSVSVSNGNLVVTVNGQSQTFPVSSVTAVNINLGNGNANLTLGSGVPSASVLGGNGNNTITSATGDDTLAAGDGNSSITAGAGDCKLIGGAGNDTLVGGSGSDHFNTGDGNSVVICGASSATAHAGAGDDTLTAGIGLNKLVGGSGTAFFVNTDGAGDTVIGGSGISYAAQNTGDSLAGISIYYDVTQNGPPSGIYETTTGATPPLIRSAPGATNAVSASIVNGILNVFGTLGDDKIVLNPNAHGNIKVRGNGVIVGVFPAADVSGIMINGAPGNDTISVSAALNFSDTLRGGPGNDSITGGGGDNALIAGAGNDTLVGGNGSNLLIPSPRRFLTAGLGNDRLVGGPDGSSNTADFSHRTDNLYLSNDGIADSGDHAIHEAVTIMPSVQNILAGTGQDTVISTTAGSFLAAGEGQCSISSGGANTILVAGSAGHDTIAANNQPANALFLLNGHTDTYRSVAISDILQTDSGSDVLGV